MMSLSSIALICSVVRQECFVEAHPSGVVRCVEALAHAPSPTQGYQTLTALSATRPDPTVCVVEGKKEGNRVRMQRSTAQSIRRKRRSKPD
jgi:hypothetical protein